mmetsp:Transcript_46572/g.104397  ORF Transcript_46572/g.104397 Transcript_46572/m.104397 type:complete len:759 (-) Transcript_46572:294-2570(-)
MSCEQPVQNIDAMELDFDHLTLDQGLHFIETQRVQPLLKYLATGEFVNNTNLTFMKAYSVVLAFADEPQNSKKFYFYYKDVIQSYCRDSVQDIDGLSGEELLSRVAMMWENLKILVFWMQRVFQYLDRFFTKDNMEYPDLFSTAMQVFEAVYTDVKERCATALVAVVNRERNGEEINSDVARKVVEMFCTVGGKSPKIVKQKPTVTSEGDRLFWEAENRGHYKSDFEAAFLASTAEFYKAKVAGWLAEYPCPSFLKEVARRMDDEGCRLTMYLDKSSEQELRRVVQQELIRNVAQHVVEMESGCRAMFFNGKVEELRLMYKLFKLEPETLQYVTDIMQPYVEERCKKVVEDCANIDDPVRYIELVLELKVELSGLVSHCFEDRSEFQKARNQGLENVLNKDTRCAKYLALFCDAQLKKGLKGKSDEETSELIGDVVALFAHLRDKDIFLDFYKRAMSKRLLNKLSISTEAEDLVISKLKVECGQQAIQKLTAMFVDMTLSEQLQEEYNRSPQGGNPGGVQHEVRVLQTHAWPEKPDEVNINPCEELATCITAFETFYNSKHSGRRLRWMFSLGGIEMNAYCYQRKHMLSVSVYQALCLMLFNKKSAVHFQEIADSTAIPKDELTRHLLSMTVSKHKLLNKTGASKEVEDGTCFEVNTQFQHEKMKMVVGLIKKEEKQAETKEANEVPLERKHVVDAAIVRIMKSRKKLDHNSLMEEVLRHCTLFKPQPGQIKMQIEHLIDREFLMREPEKRNVYIYLP